MHIGIGVGIGHGPRKVGSAGPVTLLSDDFNRADGAIGGSGTAMSGTWNVTSNQAVLTTTGGGIDRYLYTASTADVTVQVKLITGSSPLNTRIIFRHTDTGNEWWFGSIGTAFYRLYKRVANANSKVGTEDGRAPTAGDVVKVVCSGNSITCYVNGTICVGPVTDAFSNTGVKHGLGGENTSGIKWDDLLITTP